MLQSSTAKTTGTGKILIAVADRMKDTVDIENMKTD